MNQVASVSSFLACVAAGCAGAAMTLLALRSRRLVVRATAVPGFVPAPLRAALRVSAVCVPLVAAVLPAKLAHRLERRLQSLGLEDIPTAHWVAASLALGVCVGAVIGAAAAAARQTPVLPALLAGGMAAASAAVWPERQHRERDADVLRTLPSWLDLLTICVEAGSTLTNGLRIAVEQAPDGPLRQFFSRVLREIRSGRTRVDAFRRAADSFDSPGLTALSAALIHSESSGMSLGEVLREQARQRGAERFTRAERLAMQAPVRLLAPLVLFVFPCTFIVIALPIVARVLEMSR